MKLLADFRKDFPLFQKTDPPIYFDSAATAQKPDVVIEAMQTFYQSHYGTVHRGVYALSIEATERYEKARKAVQTFMGAAHPEEVIFTRGTTHSLNLLARSFSKAFLKPKEIILLSEIEHHSNLIPWQMVAEETGAKLEFIPVNDRGELVLEAFFKLLEKGVKLVSIAHISNVLGTLHPVKKIIEAAHKKGAYVALDGAQAAPHLPLDVQELDVDFYAFSGHKLYGPTGIGVLYGKRDFLEKMPPIEGGGDMVEKVTLKSFTCNRLPFKFEAGTPMIAEVIGLNKAIEYLSEIGLENIQNYEKELLEYALNRLSEIPEIRFIGTPEARGAIVSFIVEGTHPLDIATLLDCKKIALRSGHHCSQPTLHRFGLTACLRLSFGLYNTTQEIDLFTASLKNILSMVK